MLLTASGRPPGSLYWSTTWRDDPSQGVALTGRGMVQQSSKPEEIRGRFTAIWQAENPHEKQWIEEIFGDYIERHVVDGDHQLVLDNAILFDAFIDRYPLDYYRAFEGKTAFLVHFLDETYNGGYERYAPFRGVLRKHWARAFEGARIRPLPLGYCNGFKTHRAPKPASERTYLWSLVGGLNKTSRPDAVRAFKSLAPALVRATDDLAVKGLAIERGALAPAALAAVLRDSAFAPSPMGNVNLECFRLYEGLEAGAIPILERRLGLDYYRDLFGDHPLPTFASWRDAARFVAGLKDRPADLDQLQRTCTSWWTTYKVKLSSDIGAFMRERLSIDASDAPIDVAHLNSPRFQYLELLKHQTLATVGPRVLRHADRFAKTGSFRFSPTD